ncbi:DNA polymerase Y family protein [Undibacterium sp.]|uniref:Y-family DNA polymerase n=1 Tax=Undibacterium sp. TaxID=1914977 RepID=UPI00345C07DE
MLWLAVHLPLLSIEAFQPNWLADHGTVVLDKNRVVALSNYARAAGVQLGMRSGGVAMLLPEAKLRQYDAAQEQATLQRVALALLLYSPQVASAEQASLLMNIGASLRLFGGVRQLRQRVLASMALLGLSVTLGYAPSAGAAWLMAHAASATGRRGRYCLTQRRLSARLDPLPVRLLPAAAPWRDWLQGIDCHDLKSLRQLPRAGIQRRCGKALLTSLDYAYGQAAELHQWLQVPAEFIAYVELPERIEQAEALLNYAQVLLQQLSGWLRAKQLALSQLQLELEHERGRLAVAPSQVMINLAEPTWQAEHLARLLKERLAQLSLATPVIGLRLHAAQLVAMQAPSASLFPDPSGSPQQQHRLLELLVARLGSENILQTQPLADYRPEVANHWIAALQSQSKAHNTTQNAAQLAPAPAAMMNRPSWLLATPIALELRQHRPYYRGALSILSPPERIEAGWWNGQLITRDYFIAETSEHLRCWIYHERISAAQQAEQADEAAVWYLHGWFG